MRKQDGDYCNNDLENIKLFKDCFCKLYDNHEGTNYNEMILNDIDGQPEVPLLRIEPTYKGI